MTKTAWNEPSHEGKTLRRVFNMLATRYHKEYKSENPSDEKLCRIAITLGQIAHIKTILANQTITEDRLSILEKVAHLAQTTPEIPA